MDDLDVLLRIHMVYKVLSLVIDEGLLALDPLSSMPVEHRHESPEPPDLLDISHGIIDSDVIGIAVLLRQIIEKRLHTAYHVYTVEVKDILCHGVLSK